MKNYTYEDVYEACNICLKEINSVNKSDDLINELSITIRDAIKIIALFVFERNKITNLKALDIVKEGAIQISKTGYISSKITDNN